MMCLKNFRIIVLIFISTSIVANAESVLHLSLDSLFEIGVSQSLQIQGSKINDRIAKYNIADKKSARLPDINIGFIGGYSGNPTIFTDSGAEHSDAFNWTQNYNVEISQPIYQGGNIKYSIDKAVIQQQIANLSVKRDVADIKLLLTGYYLDLLRMYKQRDVILQSIAQAKQRLHDIKAMERDGLVTASDVLRSELQLSNYELSHSQITNDITILSTQIDIALGFDESLIIIPDSTILDNKPQLMLYDTYVDMAYSQYPELKMAQSNKDLAQVERKIIKSDYLPNISLRASNILARPINSTSPPLDLYVNNWNLTMVFSYNISSLYHNHQKMNKAKENIALQDIEQQKIMQQIRYNVKSDYVKHNEALERIKTLKKSVNQANENYRIVLNKYKNHIAILTDLLDAGTLQLDAQLQLTTAHISAIYTYYQLLRSTGTL